MKGINKVILVGNLGREPELKTLADGTAVARVYLATSESYRTKDGEMVTNTQWHTIILWRALATLAGTYLKKGSLIYLEGRLIQRKYTDNAGNNRRVTEVYADNLLMLDKKEKTEKQLPLEDNKLPF